MRWPSVHPAVFRAVQLALLLGATAAFGLGHHWLAMPILGLYVATWLVTNANIRIWDARNRESR